jgi:protein tyrosine phosphatase (PTP) superfamily phosphohydrolase (DUF442 family)
VKSLSLATLLAALLPACHTSPPRVPRPPHWAQPVARAGLDSLHRVSDQLWRGSQPTAVGFEQLRALGIRTVVCLRYFARDPDPPTPGLALVEIPMTAWAPNEADVLAFLRVATNPQHTPVFVHCYHGADRTGLMCAAYRRVVQGWSADDALDELRGGSFGYHEIWDDIEELVRELDVPRLRRELAAVTTTSVSTNGIPYSRPAARQASRVWRASST